MSTVIRKFYELWDGFGGNPDDEVLDLAEQFQKECHQLVAAGMKKSKKVTMQDATNVWMFKKLAELQVQINNNPLNKTV